MTQTPNYQLPQWQQSDFIKMDDFNAAFAKLDTAVRSGADAAASAAALLAASKICRVKHGSYTGTGTAPTQAAPKTLACDFYPLALVIFYAGYPAVLIRGETGLLDHWGSSAVVTWGDGGVSWYAPSSRANTFNDSGTTYHYLILGCDRD